MAGVPFRREKMAVRKGVDEKFKKYRRKFENPSSKESEFGQNRLPERRIPKAEVERVIKSALQQE